MHTCLQAFHIDMEVRWLSTYNMILEVLKSFKAVKAFGEVKANEDNHAIRLTDLEWKNLFQLEGILYPFIQFTKFFETTKTPVVPFALPLILLVLHHYGVEVADGILDSDAEFKQASHDELAKLVFQVMGVDGKRDFITYNQLSSTMQGQVFTIGRHLFFR